LLTRVTMELLGLPDAAGQVRKMIPKWQMNMPLQRDCRMCHVFLRSSRSKTWNRTVSDHPPPQTAAELTATRNHWYSIIFHHIPPIILIFPLNWKLPPRPWLRGLRIAVRLGHPLWQLGGESHRPSQSFGTLDGTDGGFKDTLVARNNCDYIYYTINIFIYTHNIIHIYIHTLYFDIYIYIYIYLYIYRYMVYIPKLHIAWVMWNYDELLAHLTFVCLCDHWQTVNQSVNLYFWYCCHHWQTVSQ
jgi:hypothetical protein